MYSAGKGVRFPAEPELMIQAVGALADVYAAVEAYSKLKSERVQPTDAIKFLVANGQFSYKSDDFGVSAYKSFETGKKGEVLRVSLVLNNERLSVDVRNWYAS